MERTATTIENLLNGSFSSDPRKSSFELPKAPKGAPKGIPHVESGVVITPEMARDWILHRTIRRDVMPKAVTHSEVVPNRKYLVGYSQYGARKLQAETTWWNKGTHQGLAFTPDGFIIDGQHRLSWCALAGVPIILPVAVNAPWSAFKDIDQNRARSAHQMLDIPHATVAAGTARYLLPILSKDGRINHSYKGREYNDKVIEVCLGWPYFAEDQPWMREVYEAGKEAGIPSSPLGAVVVGSLAAGVDADEVQQFINGLRPFSRNVPYITIGTNGSDPRQLLARFFNKQKAATGNNRRRSSAADDRSNTGVIRYAMDVWLRRRSSKPVKVSTIGSWPDVRDLPALPNEDAIRAFHDKHVN